MCKAFSAIIVTGITPFITKSYVTMKNIIFSKVIFMSQSYLQAFTSNGKATMTIPDQNLEFLISESKYDLSFYDMAEVNKEYGCPSGEF